MRSPAAETPAQTDHGPRASAEDVGSAETPGAPTAHGASAGRLAVTGLSAFGLMASASALAQHAALPPWVWWGVGAASIAALALTRRGPAPASTRSPAPAATPDPPPCASEPREPGADVRDDDREAMIYAVSHDLRAPIRVIEGFTRIVREDYGQALDRVGHDHLDRVLGAAARMNHMIDALLNLSKLATRTLEVEPVSLSDLARSVLDDLRLLSPERQAELRVQPDVVVRGDPVLLRCVMENLLSNAWKYSARRERTRIEFGARDGDGGERVYFVKDNGAGFDMRFAQRLFGAFQRLHSASEYQGTGVGLASTQRIVKRHGGRIWAEAAVNEGATFFFTLG